MGRERGRGLSALPYTYHFNFNAFHKMSGGREGRASLANERVGRPGEMC